MKPPRLSVLAALCILAAKVPVTSAADLPPRRFAHPERIRYDARCLTIDGKDTFIFSGAFHYFRCPKELWRDRFQTIKAAGFNAVETYAAWNWHEREMPASLEDFSKVDLRDLDEWLSIAEEFGFYVIIRPGPYICAEWDRGGYPAWLLSKKPETPLRKEMWLRSDDPVYLAWCKHWYDAVCPVIAPHQITRKAPGAPGVILFQIENEYNYTRLPDEIMASQLRALAVDAQDNGIDVPLFTCVTNAIRGSTDPVLRNVFDSCNFYVRWNVDRTQRDIEKLRRDQPDAPLMTSELQGGWFSQVGGKLSEQQDGLTPSQIQNLTLFVLQHGETIANYYMLFGGTNLDDWGARNQTTTYDYNAPIREHGGVGERYARVQAIGQMLREHGAKLARAEDAPCEVASPDNDVQAAVRRAQNGSRYIFIRTNQHDTPRKGQVRINTKANPEARELVIPYDLEAFGSKVLYLPPGVDDPAQGEWLPKPAPPVERPANLPAPITIKKWHRCLEPLPTQWTPLKPGQSLEQAGAYGNHFLYYRVSAPKPGVRLRASVRRGDGVSDAATGEPLPAGNIFSLPANATQAVLLYENAGFGNGGLGMEEASGIRAVSVAENAAAGVLTGWRMKSASGLDDVSGMAPGLPMEDWTPVDPAKMEFASQLKAKESAVFRTNLDLPAERLAKGGLWLTFSHIDDAGRVYVNGQLLGEARDWGNEHAYDASKLLRAGGNEIAVVIKNDSGSGGLGPVRLGGKEEGLPLEFAVSERTRGLEISRPGFDAFRWQMEGEGAGTTLEPEEPEGQKHLLEWRRFTFELPERQAGTWVPWRATFQTNGNGFVYLNGHCLGRHWQDGPQRDFYLPECWLNFGPGKENVIALSVRALDKEGAAAQPTPGASGDVGMQIAPYAEFAEKRSVR